MVRALAALAVLPAVLLAGCNAGTTVAPAITSTSFVDARAVISPGNCPSDISASAAPGSRLLGSIGNAFVGPLVNVFLGSITAAIQRAAQARTETATAVANGHAFFVTGNQEYSLNIGCISIVVADLAQQGPGTEIWEHGPGAFNYGWSNPSFYAELKVNLSRTDGVFSLEPVVVYYGTPMVDRIGERTRDVVLAVDFFKPGEITAAAPNAAGSFALVFENIQPGTVLRGPALQHLTTSWYSVASLATITAQTPRGEAGPITARATVTETTSANAFLTAVYEVMRQAEPRTSQALVAEILRLLAELTQPPTGT